MPVHLYPRQKEIFEFLKQFIQKMGHAPTLKQIANAMGLSSLATVSEHLDALEKKGVIERMYGEVRGIRITGNDEAIKNPIDVIPIPLIGYISAGAGIEPIENHSETVSIPADMVSKNKRTYILQVVGNSMIDAHICDGDQVIIEQVNTVDNGEIVVAIVDGEYATLKRFFKEANKIRLQPENPDMDPIYATNVEVKGKVIGVIRKY